MSLLHYIKLRYQLIFLIFFSIALFASGSKTDTEYSNTPRLGIDNELIVAVTKSDYVKVKELLSTGIDCNITDNSGKTSLMIAAGQKDVDMARLLLENGAKIDIKNMKSDKPQLVAFDYAVMTGDTSIVNYLLKQEAKKYYKRNTDNENNPVIIASRKGDIKMAKYLLDNGFEISNKERIDEVLILIIKQKSYLDIKKHMENSMFQLKPQYSKQMVIRFWMNYPTPLDIQEIFNSELLNVGYSNSHKETIHDYVEQYKNKKLEDLEFKEINYTLARNFKKTLKEDLQNKIEEQKKRIIDEQRILIRNIERKLAETEKDRRSALEKRSKSRNKKIFYLIILSVGVTIFIQKKYPNLRSDLKQWLNIHITKEKIKELYKIQPRISKPKKQISSGKNRGWEKDETINIKVSLVTIEDMINPIMLRNEDEKVIREMIRHIRLLSQYNEQQDERLNKKLNEMWDTIKPKNVRSIYKRSLHLIVKDYAKHDPEVIIFLKRITRSKLFFKQC